MIHFLVFGCIFTVKFTPEFYYDESIKNTRLPYWDCEPRFSSWFFRCESSKCRVHTSHTCLPDYIEAKPKRDTKDHKHQSKNQIQAMPTTRNLVAILPWSKLTDSLAYGGGAEVRLITKSVKGLNSLMGRTCINANKLYEKSK